MSRLRAAWRAATGCARGTGTSLRSCLLVLVLACVIPAAAAAALAIVEAYRDGRAALSERAMATAHAAMRQLDEEMDSATRSLQSLATRPALMTGDIDAFYSQALQVLPFQAGNNLVLTDLGGQQVMNTLQPMGAPLPRHGNPALQQRVIQTGRPLMSDLFLGGVTRRPLVALEVPVNVDGVLRYTLAMGFFPERFGSLLDTLQPEPNWIVAVFDRTGTVVARTHNAERFVGQKGAPALVAAIAKADSGLVETDTLEGLPVIAAFAHSPITGWSVAVGIPRQALLARLQRWVAWLIAATVALLLVGLAAASLIAQRVSASIMALVAPAEALGRGDPVPLLQLPLQEADAVAQALARASRLLQARTRERDEAAQDSLAARVESMRLEHEATHDPLTRLSNRAHFLQQLHQRLARCLRHRTSLTVFFVDIDDFKPVNDRHGHSIGDELLRDFSARLLGGVRGNDVVARLGGDEFAVLLDGLAPGDARPIAQALTERLSQPYSVRGLKLRVSACIGVAGFPADGHTADDLMEAADAAMYRAKSNGKGGYAMSGFGGL